MPVVSTEKIIDRISQLRVNTVQGSLSPHKYIFLLSLIKLYDQEPSQKNKFPLDSKLESTFKKTWLDIFPNSNHQDILIEYPFFHLVSDGIWQLQVFPEKKQVFYEYAKIKNRLTKKRLIETVEYGFIDTEFHKAFSEEISRKKLASELYRYFKKTEPSELTTQDTVRESLSLFAHEATAIKQIEKAVQSGNLGYFCSNIEIHDPQSNRYFEIDVFISSPFGLYVVELKHWTGSIKIIPYTWSVNGFSRTDPHKGNNFKSKLRLTVFKTLG